MTNTVHVSFTADQEITKLFSENTEKKLAIYETHRLAGELAKTIPMIMDILEDYFSEVTTLSKPSSEESEERILDLDNRFHWVSETLKDKADDMAIAMRDAGLSDQFRKLK